jgi:hypothetical protein
VEEFAKGHVDAAKIINIPYMLDTPKGRKLFNKIITNAMVKYLRNCVFGDQAG